MYKNKMIQKLHQTLQSQLQNRGLKIINGVVIPHNTVKKLPRIENLIRTNFIRLVFDEPYLIYLAYLFIWFCHKLDTHLFLTLQIRSRDIIGF